MLAAEDLVEVALRTCRNASLLLALLVIGMMLGFFDKEDRLGKQQSPRYTV